MFRLDWDLKPEHWLGLGIHTHTTKAQDKARRKRQDEFSKKYFANWKAPVSHRGFTVDKPTMAPKSSKRKSSKRESVQRLRERLKAIKDVKFNMNRSGVFDDPPQAAPATTTPAATATSIHTGTLSSLTTKSYDAPTLSTALALNNLFGKPQKRASVLSKQKRSRWASARTAYKQTMSILCPKLHLKMHTPIDFALAVASGVQAVYGDLTRVYAFPLKQTLAQIHYKLSIDVGMASKSSTFLANTAAASDVNQYIPNMDARLLPGGRLLTSAGNKQLPNPAVSRTEASDEKWNSYPGVIMKYYKRTYTFLNTGTSSVTLQIYEYIRNTKADGEAEDSPQNLWTKSLLADNLRNNNLVTPATSQFKEITAIGEVPRKHYKELSDAWRTHKLSTYTIDPQQSMVHTCFLPGAYYTIRDIFQDDTNNIVRGKGMAVMFIINGALCFEGGAPTTTAQQTSHRVIGTGNGYLNFKSESEAVFQGILQGQSYQRMYCEDDMSTTTEINHTLDTPQQVIPASFERKLESTENADASGAGATTDGAVV